MAPAGRRLQARAAELEERLKAGPVAFNLVAILGTIVAFWRVSRGAALLMVPYLLWVAFAAALNHAIWRMN